MAFAFVAVLTGFGGSQPVLASVLPPEQSAFGLEPADSDLPDAEGRRYVSVADPFQGTTEADDCALVARPISSAQDFGSLSFSGCGGFDQNSAFL